MKYIAIFALSATLVACSGYTARQYGAAPVYQDVCVEWITDYYETECSQWQRKLTGYR